MKKKVYTTLHLGLKNLNVGGTCAARSSYKNLLLILAVSLLLTCCTKKGDIIYQTDPDDAASTTPLVTVIYDPNAVGDGIYNDLIYQGVEQAAKEYGLRTMQLSPSTRDEGLAYLQTLFQQMCAAQDTVRRLFIVAAASYDDFLRQNNDRLAANPYAELLYLETAKPLTGKGSTLYLPYYGAMYEAGAIAQFLAPEVLLVAANPKVESVAGAVRGFTDGFNTDYIQYPERLNYGKSLVTEYLSDEPGGGFTIADTTAMRIMNDREWPSYFHILVPVCGGAARTFQHLNDLMGGYDLMGIDVSYNSTNSPLAAVKHIDRAVALCISQWLSPEGMPKHQTLGLSDGYTGVEVTTGNSLFYDVLTYNLSADVLTDELRTKIHEEAVKKEVEYEN
jgi:basic membrane protein A